MKHKQHVTISSRRLSNSIIRIHVMKTDSLETYTCGDLYCSAEPLPMSFTLPHTGLVHNHLRSLSCQRLWHPTTLTTWISSMWVWLVR